MCRAAMRVGAQGAYFCISWSCVMDNVAHNVHRSAARRYSPDGSEIFTDFFYRHLYNAYCAQNTEPSLPQTMVCPSSRGCRLDNVHSRNNFKMWDILCVSCWDVLRKFGFMFGLETEAIWMVCLWILAMCVHACVRAQGFLTQVR